MIIIIITIISSISISISSRMIVSIMMSSIIRWAH